MEKNTIREEIKVDQEVIDYIKKNGGDFRVCTSCGGPALVQADKDNIKDTDIVIPIGGQRLFISGSQYNWGLRKITKNVIGRKVCQMK